MKNFIATTALILISIHVMSQSEIKIPLTGENQAKFLNKTADGLELWVNIEDITLQSQPTAIGDFVAIRQLLLTKTYDEGLPEIPILSRLIEVPADKEVTLEVVSYDETLIKLEDYDLHVVIIPARRSQSKSESDVPWVKNQEVYAKNEYFNTEVVRFIESGQMRNRIMGRLEVNPIQYNPVTNTLRVLNNLIIKVMYHNPTTKKECFLKRLFKKKN